mgnify:CR=1 FL=1
MLNPNNPNSTKEYETTIRENHVENNVRSAKGEIDAKFNTLKKYYDIYSTEEETIDLNGQILSAGTTRIPLMSVVETYSYYDGGHSVMFDCLLMTNCILDFPTKEQYPGCYLFFDSKESSLHFMTLIEELRTSIDQTL